MSSNISGMEKILKEAKAETEGRGAFWCCGVEELFDLLVNSLKDLHEENTKLWKAIAELQVGEMQKFHDKVFEKNLDNRKELNIDDKDNQKD